LDTGGRDDKKAVILGLNAISWWKERVEAFDEIGVTAEQFRDALDNTRSVNAKRCKVSRAKWKFVERALHRCFEVFHDIKEVIVHVRLL
jgi:hypothetical protein